MTLLAALPFPKETVLPNADGEIWKPLKRGGSLATIQIYQNDVRKD